ncbi:hypothetical protein [Agrobacterium tumefaciens]|uniref:hypothetical protein n=1 Tax=Agrobacterium tumefaciens TaxID=358 RepID=UPI003BA283CA
MEYNFTVGQKVLAVKKVSPTERDIRMVEAAKRAGVIFPKPGEVYTIRDIFTAARIDGEVVVCVRLVEVINNPQMRFNTGFVGEIGFNASCFRPLIERKTDISIFKAMLTPSKEQVPA